MHTVGSGRLQSWQFLPFAGVQLLQMLLRYLRSRQVEQQLAEALAQAPENAGPLNSHLLALQSLKLMRDVSPGYLKRFVSYVDALLWLDQADNAGKPAPKSAAKGEKDRKRKAAPRGRA